VLLLVGTWSELSVAYPDNLSLTALFERQILATPEQVAVESAGTVCSYSELNRRVNRLSFRLQALGIGAGSTVAICARRSLENIAAVLAVLKTGAAVVPVDPGYPPERLQRMVTGSNAGLLLLGTDVTERFGGCAFRDCIVMPLREEYFVSPDYPDQNPQLPVDPDDAAFVLFTSGSSGQPKAV